MSFKAHFERCLSPRPTRLHFAAHSHHLWPDVTFDAHMRAWEDAAELLDEKWGRLLGEVVPEAQGHVARTLGLPDPTTIAFGPNTHGFVLRILSCFDRAPVRLLTTDAEFHSFDRQSRRLEEAGRLIREVVPSEPFETFADRFLERTRAGGYDLVYVSHVFFNSGYVFEQVAEVARAVPHDGPFVVIDGYHGFLAVPTDLSTVAERVFYLAGGYKYAMSGEGACFLHCPPGWGARPVDTGWFAGFGELEAQGGLGQVRFAADGSRFLGATFDPTALYRMNAVFGLLADLGLEVADIHAHVRRLQRRFVERLDDLAPPGFGGEQLVPDRGFAERGHFLTFRMPNAAAIHRRLRARDVITDVRGDRLRIGFGLYHDDEDVDALCQRLLRALASSDTPIG